MNVEKKIALKRVFFSNQQKGRKKSISQSFKVRGGRSDGSNNSYDGQVIGRKRGRRKGKVETLSELDTK